MNWDRVVESLYECNKEAMSEVERLSDEGNIPAANLAIIETRLLGHLADALKSGLDTAPDEQ